MKIIFLTKELPYPVNSGHRMRSYHYIRGLLRGNDVRILCFNDKERINERVGHFKDLGCSVELVDYKKEDMLSKSKIAKCFSALGSLFCELPFSIRSRYSFEMKQRLTEEVDMWSPDVVVCDGIHQSMHIGEGLNCYKVLDEHNIESTIIDRFLKVERNILKKKYACLEFFKFLKFEERIWPVFNEIHVCSLIDKVQIEKRNGHKKVTVIPNGVDINEFKRSTAPINKKRIIFTGLIGWRPNEDAVIYFLKNIYGLIKDKVPKVELFIVGKDPTEKVLSFAEGDSSVTVTGSVYDVKPFVSESNIFVVPLRIGSGTRLKILEAMAMKKAIVSTTIGCEGLEVSDYVNIMIADDPLEFAERTIRLINDDVLREKIAESGRKLVEEKYDWDLIEVNLNEVIKEIK